jgi:hypothetical protein
VKDTKFGIYFYPWYNAQRWKEAPRKYTPLIGEYDSTDPNIIEWQLDLIKSCGIDYVIFELIPQYDWCFETVSKSIEIAIEKLREMGMKWSFLIDTKICPPDTIADPKSELNGTTHLIDYMLYREWFDGIIEGTNNKPLLFIFSPVPPDTELIQKKFTNYEFRFPAYFPHWGNVDGSLNLSILNPFTQEPKKKKLTLHEYLLPLNYISFWESNKESSDFNGFCSVIPEYDDTLLKRSPQLAPKIGSKNGETYKNQFESALEHKPEHIIIYSWNEYFESTNIEPTKEYEMLYVNLTREFITRVTHLKSKNI